MEQGQPYAGGASAALSDAPLEHASWATQQTGPGAEEATALADIVGIDVQNLQRNLALWQCHGTKQLFTLGDKEHSLQCPTGPSNLVRACCCSVLAFNIDEACAPCVLAVSHAIRGESATHFGSPCAWLRGIPVHRNRVHTCADCDRD